MSFNKIIIVGNLGRDPELRYTPQGTAVCTFTMATNERRKDKAGEQQDVTTWFKINVWGRQAETVSKYLTKGRQAYVEGRLHVDEWTDKDGKTRNTLEVNASDVHFIDGGGGGGGADREGIPVRQQQSSSSQGGGGGGGGSSRGGGSQDIEDDEIPF